MGWLLVGAVLWAATGLAVAIWQRRRGHHLVVWVLLGIVYGPITYVLAVDAERRMPRFRAVPRVAELGPGQVDVLIGLDGSERSRAAALEAIELLGDRRRRVVVATVIDRESGLDDHLGRAAAEERLESFLGELEIDGVGTIVVSGPPGPTLAALAEEDGFDVVVVGARGSGMSQRLLGSATAKLIGHSTRPVLVGGTARELSGRS
ncbi:MAG: universal stress protein [Actinomycetota bacterium]